MPVESTPWITHVATKLQKAAWRSTRRALDGRGPAAPGRRCGAPAAEWRRQMDDRAEDEVEGASARSAPRQPKASIRTCVRGMKTVLARPPTRVMTVMPRRDQGPEAARQDGEARLVEDRAHGGAEADPEQHERPDSSRPATRGRGGRRGRSDPPVMTSAAVAEIDEAPDRHRAEAGGHEAERKGGGELRPRPAEVPAIGCHEQGEGVEDRPPGHELRRRERGHEPPGHAGGAARRCERTAGSSRNSSRDETVLDIAAYHGIC